MPVPKGTRVGGRQKGTPNKVGTDLREAAKAFTNDALEVLAQIMRASESDAARVAAANSILDRGHGKPRQALEVDANVTATVTEVRRTIVDPRHPDA